MKQYIGFLQKFKWIIALAIPLMVFMLARKS